MSSVVEMRQIIGRTRQQLDKDSCRIAWGQIWQWSYLAGSKTWQCHGSKSTNLGLSISCCCWQCLLKTALLVSGRHTEMSTPSNCNTWKLPPLLCLATHCSDSLHHQPCWQSPLLQSSQRLSVNGKRQSMEYEKVTGNAEKASS